MKVYYKVFIFNTAMYIILFFGLWYGYNPETCDRSVAYLAPIMWFISTVYLLTRIKFKK